GNSEFRIPQSEFRKDHCEVPKRPIPNSSLRLGPRSGKDRRQSRARRGHLWQRPHRPLRLPPPIPRPIPRHLPAVIQRNKRELARDYTDNTDIFLHGICLTKSFSTKTSHIRSSASLCRLTQNWATAFLRKST